MCRDLKKRITLFPGGGAGIPVSIMEVHVVVSVLHREMHHHAQPYHVHIFSNILLFN